jgi:hypothetical protein
VASAFGVDEWFASKLDVQTVFAVVDGVYLGGVVDTEHLVAFYATVNSEFRTGGAIFQKLFAKLIL